MLLAELRQRGPHVAGGRQLTSNQQICGLGPSLVSSAQVRAPHTQVRVAHGVYKRRVSSRHLLARTVTDRHHDQLSFSVQVLLGQPFSLLQRVGREGKGWAGDGAGPERGPGEPRRGAQPRTSQPRARGGKRAGAS